MKSEINMIGPFFICPTLMSKIKFKEDEEKHNFI
jgi:hypothetical protein